LWLLRNKPGSKRNTGVHAHFENINHVGNIQMGIIRRLGSAGVSGDASASGPSQFMRVPGSTNSKATPERQLVTFTVRNGLNRKPCTYSLESLLDFFQISRERPNQLYYTRIYNPDPVKSKSGKMGWKQRHLNDFVAFLDLWDLRGGFHKGCRHNAIFIVANSLRQIGRTIDWARPLLEMIGQDCNPSLSAFHVEKVARSAYRKHPGRITHNWIALRLKITPAESSALNHHWPCPTVEREIPYAVRKRAANQNARQEAILSYMGEMLLSSNQAPSLRKMAQIVKERTGMSASPSTISRDYRSLTIGPNTHTKSAPPSYSPILGTKTRQKYLTTEWANDPISYS